ncbi:hydrocephalus-inducing protein homolog isoform X3 [Brachyhypopomus gauderio]|uniref:hydrocephalus-inducing protein homolog isoform X3 n=1 Tax=Brachyhypopomus gauderio TaxID=698409 RepID=UPI0040417D15
MLTSKIQASQTTLQNLPLKMPHGFKTKVMVPRNPKLVKLEDKAKKRTPSAYALEMSQTTEERLANTYEMHPPRILQLLDMSVTTHQKFSAVDVDQPLFQPYPSEIVFQNYIPFKTYEVPLVLRNIDTIPRHVKVLEEDSLYFKVVSPVDIGCKVAPGMTSTFTVFFTPHEKKDYIHRLVCVTEREKFEVPIKAIGAYAILDFPDQVHFPPCPVKCSVQNTLLVRNIGHGQAIFQLSTQSPFSVEPSVGTLGVGESMQITIEFLPRTTGNHSQLLLLHYNTGEDVYISLYGASSDVNVRLDRNSVLLEKTFITMASERTVAILNRSDSIVHYQWKRFATQEEEDQHKLRFCMELEQEEEDEMEQFLIECGADPTMRDRLSLLSRTFQHRRRQLRQEQLVFSDQHITLEPQEGDIWPSRTAEINIIFKPQEARLYQLTLYCDVTGREARLPLRIKAEGIGPRLQLNFHLLDVGNVFVGSKHSYEVLMSNKGLIDASYRLVPPSTAMGMCFSFSPAEGMVPPGACHALEVHFSSHTLGTFSEELHFTVEGNPQPLGLTFRGCVMGPTFHFSVPELNFGEVSFGFPFTLTCCLSNTSLVSMSFDLRIPGDGMGADSITTTEQISQLDRNEWTTVERVSERPREFRVTPTSGSLRAQSQMDVKVTLCSNTVQQYSLALVVDVHGVGEEVLALPIKARCVVPEVHLESSELQFQHCFLGYPYQQSIRLSNHTDLPACYGLLDQDYEENPSLLYSSPHPRGVIKPCSAEQIPLVLQAKTVGPQHLTARIAILGHQRPPLELHLSCTGQGPSTSLSATELHFGTIPVLSDIPRTLQLFNNSPIPACFETHTARSRSQWRVVPTEGEVPPHGQLELCLVAHLDDTLHVQDTLHLAIQGSPTHTVAVTATGKGTTIVTDRPFAPSLDLGTHFSSGPCRYHFRISNRGRRLHQLYWTTEGFPQFRRRGQLPARPSKEGKSLLVSPPLDAPVFLLTPMRLELAPGQSAHMLLEGSCDVPKVVREKLVCHAIVGHQRGKDRIMTVDVTCQFIAPVLDISSQQLNFYVEKVPGESPGPQYQRLHLKSVCTLALSLELTVAEPFGLCECTGDDLFTISKCLVLGTGAETEVWVRFDPSFRPEPVSRVAEGALEIRYSGHPQRDSVALRGEVHFPNLHFSSKTVDFGCVLNCTEAQRQLTMTNCSPLPVSYRWAFLLDQQHYAIRFPCETSITNEVTEEKQYETRQEPSPTPGASTRGHWSRPQLVEEESVDKEDPESEIKEGTLSLKRSSSTSGPDVLRLENLTHNQNSSIPHGQNNFGMGPTVRPTGTEQGLSTASLMSREVPSVGVEEVFDILPIYGVLQPGESQQVTFSFFGHAHISGQMLALCEVEEGPTYEITVKGEASLVTYALDTTDIDLGPQVFDRVAEAEITLRNTGKVGFDFSAPLQGDQVSAKDPLPGQPMVIPGTGHLEANAEMKLSVYYLPGMPDVFHRTFQLQVAFFEPEDITLRGEGVFPRVCLDLPRDLDEERYSSVLKEAKEAMESRRQREEVLSRPGTGGGEELPEEDCIPTYDVLLQMEVERLLVRENVKNREKSQRHPEQKETPGSTDSRRCKKLSRFVLPDYILDFGCVVHGNVPTHIIKVTNTGPVSVSFRAEHQSLAGTGFSTELDRVKNLPYCETETFEVKFDPRGANLDLGEISTVMPLQVLGGPTVQVRLRAVVTMPSLIACTDVLQFDSVRCGMCQVITVQLHNPEHVPCEWSIEEEEEEQPKRKAEKRLPPHLRRKVHFEQPPPLVFEMLPSSGVVYPGDRVNVQVKFTPAEGRAYRETLVIVVTQSTQRVLLVAQGQGEEPQLQFSTSVLELGPVLPYSNGEEAIVLVHNPCPYSIEFYSLDFDMQYLEEEKILRMMKGYDAQNVLLLPPRAPGESLPAELLDFYKQNCSQEPGQEFKSGSHTEDETSNIREKGESAAQDEDFSGSPPEEHPVEEDRMGTTAVPSKDVSPSDLVKQDGRMSCVGDLEVNPVSRAKARYMGADLSPEGRAARNRRGIAIVVHGAPHSGKTALAVSLARRYGAACLTLDGVVQEAVSSGTRSAAIQARELMEVTQMAVEDPDVAGSAGQTLGVLSVEAVARHTAEGVQATDPKAPASTVSTRNKTSTTGPKKNNNSNPAASMVQRLPSESMSQTGELAAVSGLLPDEMLVEILSERLQLSDCHRGVVIDSLETIFCRSPSAALQIVLKAFNNRQHIYVIDLIYSYNAFKATERERWQAAEAIKKEQMEREQLRLQEMDEDEYDALPEEERELIDLQHREMIREHKRRKQKRLEQEQEERRQHEEMERLREEEEMRKKNKRGKKEVLKEDSSGKRSQLGGKQSAVALRSDTKLDQQPAVSKEGRTISACTESKDGKDSPLESARELEEGGWKKKSNENKDDMPGGHEDSDTDELERELCAEADRQLLSRFRLYEQSQSHVRRVLQCWDRTQGVLLQMLSSDEQPQEPEETTEHHTASSKRAKKEREKEKADRERQERERLKTDAANLKLMSVETGQAHVLPDGTEASERESVPQVIPHICVFVSGKEHPSRTELLCSSKLPSLEEVLDGLGLGPKGPPIPPPMVFSVVPYPKRRSVPQPKLSAGSFTFLVPLSLEDQAEGKKGADLDEHAPTPIVAAKEEVPALSKGKGKKAAVKEEVPKESLKDKRRSAAKKGVKTPASRSPHLSAVTSSSDIDPGGSVGKSQSARTQRLTHFRWVVPANGEVTMKIWFHSTMAGTFDQTLSFEVMGTKRCYQLCCRGTCTFPSISKDPKTVFAHCKKILQPENGSQKTYIIRSDLYDFGPLLCRKTIDRQKEKKYPENSERLVMHNNSPMEAEVNFCFQHDTKAMTFSLDPPNMVLKPNEKKELRVWAYPTTPGVIEDSVVCYIKENPEPAVFRIACRGVRPELEVEKKVLNFDKILLHRSDTQSLQLRNPTLLPVAWRLSGLEMLREEVSVSQDHGTIKPHSEVSLLVHFRAIKPIHLKKAIRLEVSDEENILDIVQTENIHIIAEAYDVALDITFPKGADGGLDFGKIKVGEEVKLSVNLKNKGKYEIAYKFMLEPTEPGMPNLNSLFTITPLRGSLHPTERPTAVQLIFHYSKEVSINEQPILQCQVIEPNIAEGGETIAIIPIKISVQSVFSKYSLTPSNDINFGALVHGCRNTRTLTMENRGDFDIRFVISRMCKDFSVPAQKKSMGRKPSRESPSARPSNTFKLRRSESVQKDTPTQQTRLTMGVFSLTPCFGVLPPGAQQVVTVECLTEQTGHWQESLVVDISDRDPSDSPGGVPYRLIAEVCMPGIAYKDFASIFEEHRLCKNSNMLHCEQYRDAMGIYIQDENKFVFNNVLVGRSAKARFRLSNPGKVPCELNLQVKAVHSKVPVRISEAFELTPARMTIPSHSHAFATVSFSPQAMQTYLAVFEATLEAATSVLPTSKGKVLVFDLMGQGNLPYITVLKPVQKNSQGQPVLQFNQLLVGKRQSLPLVIKNISSVPAQVSIDLLDKMGVFALQAAQDTVCSHIPTSHITSELETDRQTAHVATVTLKARQQAMFKVEFRPERAQSFEAVVQLLVQDNQYEETVVQLVGEGYCDIISLDCISSRVHQDQDSTETSFTPRSDLLHFGDCHVGRLYRETFTLSNHSDVEVLRFEWPPDGPHVRFSPRTGHLHAGCTKEIAASFCSEQPVVLIAQVVKCKLCRITFQQPVDQVPDWDDRLHTVRWVETGTHASTQHPAKRKVVETDPEPSHLVSENSSRELELRISATCNYTKFKCDVETIQFKDTMLYQTRVYQIQMDNQGTVELEYSWHIMTDTCGKSGTFTLRGTTPRSAQGSRTGLRPASSLASVSTLLLGDPELPPFSMEPSVGLIQAGASQTFSLRFSPLDVGHYEARLVCSVPNLQSEQGPVIAVSGSCLLPYCHFHLENCDYLSMNRRSPELRGPHGAPPRAALDPNTKVIKFTSVGVGTDVCKEFSIINPTSKPYSFLWKCEDCEAKPFTCLTPNSTIQPGKKVDISFRFRAQDPDLVESFWTFLIPEYKHSVPFLLVGIADDPVVYIDHAHLNLGSVLIGHKIHKTVHVVNGEDQAFRFTVEEASRHAEAFRESLLLEPMVGTVPPRDKIPLDISFTPTQEGTVTFNLQVAVRGKVQPLTLNIKGDGYSMNACVLYESPGGDVTELSTTNVQLVNFKLVELNYRSTCAFLVSNPGKFNLDVQFELTGPADLQRHLQVEPRTAVVPVGEQSRCILSFLPLQKCDLKDMGFSIKVKNGPVFHCSLLGSASPPGLEFSFIKFNFGMSFIYYAGMVPSTQTLVISNKGERGISVDCLFSNTPFLETSFSPEVLPPGGCMDVLFTFYPREAVHYNQKVVFDINGCSKQVVEILGQGIEMKIDIEDPKQKVVKLGALQVGQSCRRLIPVINHSRSPLTFSLLLTLSTHTLLDAKVLSVRPEGDVTLRGGGGRCELEVLFAPKQRIAPFSAELQLECLGTVRPLLVLKGSCHGVEVTLDQDYLFFGAVTQHCQTTRRIILQNTGDIGARFHWDLNRFAPDFSICPSEGYICPGMEVSLEVTFAPVEVKQDLCYSNLCCSIEGGKPVSLTLAGSCVTPPVATQVVNFVCPVRGQCTQTLALSNRTNQRWSLKPVIDGEHWSASPTFILEPYQQNKPYEITYKPTVMTTDSRKHLGSAFFSFPDGSGMRYTLQGTADPPKAVGTISHDVPCKTPYTEIVPVHNWLPKPQRFRVTVEMVKPERPDITVFLKGLDYVDVPGLAKQDYKISFFSYKEGQYHAKVTFKNETTGEYLFYLLNFKATPPGVISTIEMVTAARQTTSACVKVDNPLPMSLVFSTECRSMDVSVPSQLSVPALSTGTLTFEYQPLRPGESTTRLTLHNSELGFYHYELLLRGLPAPAEKPLYFQAMLGSGHSLNAKFTNYSRVKAEYTCKTDCPDFVVEKTITAAAGLQAGTDVSVEVYFEPSQLGEVRGTLTLSSSLAGEYVFPLYGTCLPPKVQGPLAIRAGSSITIPFKNVFLQATAFSFQVNNPAFTVKGVETIRSKKTHNVLVTFEGPPAGSRGPCTGKLTISSPRSEGYGQVLSWVYYLKGFYTELAQREKTL